MGRPSNRAQRRAEIVAGLRAVMAERGYDGASVQAIAERAGLASGLVHYHFKNKQEILLALVDELVESVTGRYERRLTAAATPWERLEAWIDAHVALGEDADPAAVACWVAIGAEAVRQPQVRVAYEAAVRADLSRGQELVEAVWPAASETQTRRVATSLLAAMEGAFRLAAGAPGAVEPGFAAAAVKAMARGLVGAPIRSG